jgi:hypothetical protein
MVPADNGITNRDASERLAARIGEQAGDLSSEHERWRLYQRAADMPPAWAGLLAAIASEPVPPLATATALQLLERVPPDMRNAVVGVLADRQGSDFAALRSRELGILDSLAGGTHDVGDVRDNLDSWSTWLQLRAAGTVADERILAELAGSGRTKRVRLTASERLTWLQLRAAGEETDPGILAELARSGRTRRVRTTASERLRVTG